MALRAAASAHQGGNRSWLRLRVREKLFALVLIPLLVLAVLVCGVLWSLRLSTDAAHETSNSVAALRLAFRLQRTLIDAETGMRGYVATERPVFLQPYNESRPELALRVGLFLGFAGDDYGTRKQAVLATERAFQAMALVDRYVDLTKKGRRSLAVAELREGSGKRSMDAFRSAITTYQEAEIRRYQTDTKNARLVEQRTFQMVVAGFAIAIVLVMVPFATISRSLVSRIRRLEQHAIAFKSGQPAAQSIGDENDEIAEVERALQSMFEALEQRHTAIAELNVLQHAILDEMGYGISTMTKDGTLTSFNRGAEKLLGYRAADVIGKMTLEHFCLPEDLERVAATIKDSGAPSHDARIAALLSILADPRAREREWTCVRADGAHVPIMTTLTPLRGDDGEIFGYLSVAYDQTERKISEVALRREREQSEFTSQLRSLDATAETSDEAPENPVEAALALVLAQIGLDWAYLATVDAGKAEIMYVHSTSRNGKLEEAQRAGARVPLQATRLGAMFQTGEPLAIADVAAVREDADREYPSERAGSYLAVPVRVFQRVYGAMAFLGNTAREPFTQANLDFARLTSDLIGAAIERDLQRERLDALAFTDALTELPNRVLLHDRLLQTFLSAERHSEQFAIFYIDLDDFKRVNDTFGHAVGDSVLQVVAKRLTSLSRDSDTLARLGGNEFVVVASKLADLSDATRIAERILAALRQPFAIKGTTYALTASIGISLFPPNGRNAEMLFEQADIALCMAKTRGKNCFVFANNVDEKPLKPLEGVRYIRLVS